MLWTAAACAAVEMIGWIGRLGSALNQEWTPIFGGGYAAPTDTWFLMQICCLIIAPAFLAAALYSKLIFCG